MQQIIFNEISAREMSSLPKELQLDLLAEFQFLPEDLENLPSENFGKVQRGEKILRRFRAKDYRIYFEIHPEGLLVHRVLHRNTLKDFLFRARLPLSEDEELGRASEFWKLIEEGERSRRQK